MTKLIYPGVAVALTPFSWFITDMPSGTNWEVKVYDTNNQLVSTDSGVQATAGDSALRTHALPLGRYTVRVTAGAYASALSLQSLAKWEFIWRPDTQAQSPNKPRVRLAQFGDGYAQAMRDGLNANLVAWNLNFTRLRDDEVTQLDLFLKELGGAVPFRWKNPDGVVQRFRCAEWSITRGEIDDHSLSATFTQVP